MKNIHPSNPTSCFVDGQHQREYTYDPGFSARPFYVQVRGGSYLAMSVVIFAQDIQHVCNIIEGARMHIEKCNEEYYKATNFESAHHIADLVRQHDARLEKWKSIEAAVFQQENPHKLTAEIRPFTGTHMIKVAWASNDTI